MNPTQTQDLILKGKQLCEAWNAAWLSDADVDDDAEERLFKLFAEFEQLVNGTATDTTGVLQTLRTDCHDLQSMITRLTEEGEVWRRLIAWREADRRRIVRIDSTWADDGGLIWSVDLYPGVSMTGQVASQYSRSLPSYNPRLWIGEPGRNAALPALVKAALDYHEELELMKEEG